MTSPLTGDMPPIPAADFEDRLAKLLLMLKPHAKRLQTAPDRAAPQPDIPTVARDALAALRPVPLARAAVELKSTPRLFQTVSNLAAQLARSGCGRTAAEMALRNSYVAATEQVGAHGSAIDAANAALTLSQLEGIVVSILMRAYSVIEERETSLREQLFGIAVASPNAEIFWRQTVEALSSFAGSGGAHLFVRHHEHDMWNLAASTAHAVSRLAEIHVTMPTARKRLLEGPISLEAASQRDQPLFLDPGWTSLWPAALSIPAAGEGGSAPEVVLQLGFTATPAVWPREVGAIVSAMQRCLAAAGRIRALEQIAERESRMRNLARRMLQVEEIERRRISRELHDDPGQSLVVIRLQMEMLEQSLPESENEWRERLSEARDLTEKTILDIRRLISDLSPAVLEQLGLAAGIRQLISRFRRSYPCHIRFAEEPLPPMDSVFAIVVYRLLQECLINIRQHSQATRVNISLKAADGVLRLRVIDNGVGFDTQGSPRRKDCFGLIGMRERVALLGGEFWISSTPKGEVSAGVRKRAGTQIDIEMPIPEYSSSNAE